MTVCLEQEESDRGDDCRACQIEQAFERINSKEIGNGQLFFARQQQRPYRFTGAAKKKDSRKARERHRVNRPETRGAQISLEDFPAQRTQRVTGVDGDDGKNQQEGIGIADGVEQLCPAKIRKIDHSARTADDKPQQQQSNQDDKKLPRRFLHALASLTGASTCVKLPGRTAFQFAPNFLAVRRAASSPVRRAPSLERPSR